MQSRSDHLDEMGHKAERLAHLARRSGLAGIVVSTQPNFSWLTAGGTNRIDGSRESGSGALLVAADGRRFALANRIEAGRLETEALAGLGFQMIEYSWTDERADPVLPFHLAVKVAGGSVGSDAPSPAATPLETRIARLRAPLVPSEIDRYRALGRDVGRIIGEVAAACMPGTSECEIAATLIARLAAADARAVVVLAGADDRIARYRHPTPTGTRWRERLMIVTCAERSGLVAAASRIVSARPVDEDLSNRTRATAEVYAALLGRTCACATGAQLFATAAAAYASAGFPGEEQLHHQGGAIGYRSRDWIAHPGSDDTVAPPQAFAWNPSVTGVKIEETSILAEDGRHQIITSTPGWPAIHVKVDGADLALPDVLVLGQGLSGHATPDG